MVIVPSAGWIVDQLQFYRIPQKDLAAALSLDPSAVTRLLKGSRRLKEAELPALQAFFARYGTPAHVPPPRLLRALTMRIIDADKLCQRSGVTRQRLLEIKLGQGEKPSENERRGLAEALGQTVEYLFSSSMQSDATEREMLREGARMHELKLQPVREHLPRISTEMVPLYRAMRRISPDGSYDGQLVMAGQCSAPERLRHAIGAFGVHVADAASAPMLLPGDIFFVDPGRPPLVGERVFARFKNGAAAVGILCEPTAGRPASVRQGETAFEVGDAVSLESIVVVVAR